MPDPRYRLILEARRRVQGKTFAENVPKPEDMDTLTLMAHLAEHLNDALLEIDQLSAAFSSTQRVTT